MFFRKKITIVMESFLMIYLTLIILRRKNET